MEENNNNHCVRKIRKIIIWTPRKYEPKDDVSPKEIDLLLHSLLAEESKGTCPSCGAGARKVMWCHTPEERDGQRSIKPKVKVKIRKVKAYKKPEIEESFISEVCPHCDEENTFIWDVTKDGMMAFCPHCGKPMLICSMCEDQRCGKCPYEEE